MGRSQFILVLLVILLVAFFWGMQSKLLVHNPSSSPVITLPSEITPFPRKLYEATGEILLIPKRPQRIISQTLATDEILLAICPLERIIAVSTLALDPQYSNVIIPARQVAQSMGDNVERILSLQPDLILVASYTRAETLELLKTSAAPILRLTQFQRIEEIKNNIRLIGYAIGEEQRAADLIAQMSSEIQAILAQIPTTLQPPRVISYSLDHYTAGRYTTFDDIVKLIGAINIAAEQGIEQYAKVSDEQILTWQPQFIISYAQLGEFDQVYQQLLNNPAIAASEAGQAGRIIIVDNRYLLAVSQYIVKAIKVLADSLY
ncbi:ABC-type Fe3+-hydroxamate transport system, periplasmic component [Thioploca ingrica]|uniref:ABC-type Fe3+-hydroxamate transport system, periplasmic component n=1 Tax=Thioploca ingrica TaxID=40754 RepID=A0A090AK05_9GAMM|nr:ABC-type Fe3+-hydroxamate transport system, periplasmic component [Thioploca ingrica]